MHGAAVNANLGEHLAAEGALGHHAANSFVNSKCGLLIEKLTIADFLQSSGITGMMDILFAVEFAAGQGDLGGKNEILWLIITSILYQNW